MPDCLHHNKSFKRGIGWLQQSSKSEQPWFILLHTNIVHDYYFNKPYYDKYNVYIEKKKNISYGAISNRMLFNAKTIWNKKKLSSEETSYIKSRYYSGVRYASNQLAKLLGSYDPDNTMVILVSDHGEGFDQERGYVYHRGRLQNDLLHVPLIIHPPHNREDIYDLLNQTVSRNVSTIDIVPTIYDILEIPFQVDGVSLLKEHPPDRSIRMEDSRIIRFQDCTLGIVDIDKLPYQIGAEINGNTKMHTFKMGDKKRTLSIDLGQDFYELNSNSNSMFKNLDHLCDWLKEDIKPYITMVRA
jgi:arylsulfatase A-like enzyme